MEETPLDANNPMTAHRHMIVEFAFNIPIEMSLFRMTPPDGYHTLKNGPLFPVPPAPKDNGLASPVITPGVGIGEARFGMNAKQIIERLGTPSELWYGYEDPVRGFMYGRMKPDRDVVKFMLHYKSAGFTLDIDAREGLTSIGTNDGIPEVEGYRAFAGRTKEGIAFGATRADIEQAYGVPERIRGPYKYEEYNEVYLLYGSKRLYFGLRDGEVNFIQAKKPKREADE
jgi:hypothetical protein